MKKFLALMMAFAILISAQAAPSLSLPSIEKPVPNANTIMLPVGNTGKTISLMELSKISVEDFQKLTGKKMSAFDKFGFKKGQKRLQSKINADGTLKSKSLIKAAEKTAADGTTGFHLGGFALGFLLGLIGVLIAYLINDDKKQNRVKWAWIGLGVVVVIIIIGALL